MLWSLSLLPHVSALPPLRTERLRLRPFTDADAPFLLDLLNQPSFIEHIADRGVRTLGDALRYLHDRLLKPARPGIGMWAVEPRAGGTVLGMAGLVSRDGLDSPDLGYAFLPDAWGHGYAREAAAALVGYARDALGLERLVAIVTPGNDASIRVLTHLGMQFERALTLPDDDDTVALYSLALSDTRNAPPSAP